jgi:uncharacterized protein YjbJ (UPF0337 family)
MDENTVEGAARNFGGKVQEAVGDLTGDANTKVRGKINQAAGTAQNTVGGLMDDMNDFGEMVSDTVRDKPLQSLGIALAIGLLIGFIVRR